MRSFTGHAGYVSTVVISPDGRYLITGSYDETTRLWDLTSGENLRTFTGHSTGVSSIAISPDGRSFFTVGETPQPFQHWLPWGYYEQVIQPESFHLTQLKAMGLQYDLEDVKKMMGEGRNWDR
ncbi:MAG: hypothetical protein R3B47_00915 [Bacteroidia bacterium]